jgi:hypothetical protein
MNSPFPSRFAFAISPIASRSVPAGPAAPGLAVRALLRGLGLFALVAAAALVAG